MEKTLTPKLNAAEAKAFAAHEAIITAKIGGFIEVGEALMDIRDGRLYREDHETFEDYCQTKWGFGRMQGWRIIQATLTAQEIAQNVTSLDTNGPPLTEGQARPLGDLPVEQRPDAWARAIDTSGKPQPSAAEVQVAVDEIKAEGTGAPTGTRSAPKKGGKKATKPVENIGQLADADPKLKAALTRIALNCGRGAKDGILNGAVKTTSKDVLLWAEQTDNDVTEVGNLIIQKGFNVKSAIRFLANMPTKSTRIDTIVSLAAASIAKEWTGEFDGWIVTVTKSKRKK